MTSSDCVISLFINFASTPALALLCTVQKGLPVSMYHTMLELCATTHGELLERKVPHPPSAGGYTPRQFLNAFFASELARTYVILENTVGFCIMCDGASKKKLPLPPECWIVRDVGPDGEFRTRTLGSGFHPIFCEGLGSLHMANKAGVLGPEVSFF